MRDAVRAIGSLALALALAGCGGRAVTERPVATVADPGAEPQAPPIGRPSASPPSSPPRTPTGRTPMDPPTLRATGNPDYGSQHNNGAVHLELSAECVMPGDVLVVTIITSPKAGLGMVIGYADNQAHGAMATGESGDNGRYTWRVPVAPTVPDGQARVLVSASGADWGSEGGGTADRVFRVARAGC